MDKKDLNQKAELDACVKFLNDKIGKEAVDNLLNVSEEMVVNTAKSLMKQFQDKEVCNLAERLANEKADIGKLFKPELENLLPEMLPLASTIVQEGKQSWSRTGSRKLHDKSNVTFTLKAINPDFDSEEAKKARLTENTVSERLAKFLDKRFKSIVELVKFERGTKTDGTKQVALYKRPIEYGGLKWQIYLGDSPAPEEDE